MINKAWTILNRGVTPTSPYGRKLSPSLYNDQWRNQQAADILVPVSIPVLEQHFRIEQLVQGVRRSSLSDRLAAFDPINTYEKVPITYPGTGFTTDSSYEAFFSGSIKSGDSFVVSCTLDPIGLVFTVEGETQSFTITNELTSGLVLPGSKEVRFRGPFTIADTFTITFMPYLKVPWSTLITQLDSIEIEWRDADLRAVWLDDYLWLNRISAVVMAAVEGGSI